MKSATLDLNPQRWARVERLFDAVADLSAAERADYLSKACDDDFELRAYVESLAQSDFARDTIIESSIRNVLQAAAPGPSLPRDVAGERIGPYRIARLIGSGGMGAVYQAERVDQHFRQQVAIKLVRQRLTDPEIERRLVSERQILADLDHPNIARLLDGGTTSDGTPYLVMEYIQGMTIDDYCDGRRLDVTERLRLFRTICSAVHYAHQKLVVHRDIKPSNILVTDDGTPKLLDFGIAKLLDASGAATDGLTRHGVLVMTPENAAPEQVSGGAITTATDIYALGILLYRLLCGHPPYQVSGSRPRDLADIICHRQPEPPSAMVTWESAPGDSPGHSAEKTDPALISRYRSTPPERLRRQLSGDLDNIVLTALRKEPQRRYRSVNELSEDIRLHLASMPVRARPDTWRYRTGKFLLRHYAGVGMSSLLVLILVSFGIAMAIQNQRIVRERDTAEEVSTFLEEIFMAPDPGNARGLDVTAKELLTRGADRIAAELSERPIIRATLMETIGRVYFNLGEYDRSIEMLEESLRLRRLTFGDSHRAVASSKNELAVSLIQTADYNRARTLLEEAIEQNRGEFGDYSSEVAANLYNLAELSQKTGDLNAAGQFAAESLAIYSAKGDQYAREIAAGKSTLARILHDKNELDAAEKLYREGIAVVREHLGEDHYLMAYYLQNLAVLLQTKGEIEAAETMFHESIAVTRRVLGDEHTLLGGSLVMLGTLLHNKGRYEDAEAAFRDALTVHSSSRGAEHPFVAYDMTSLAILLHDTGRTDEAESLLKDALRIYERSLGGEHQYVASALTELGLVLTSSGRAEEAMPLLTRAMEIRSKDHSMEHPLVAATGAAFGHVLASLGRFEEAESLLLDNHERLLKAGDQASRATRRTRRWLAELYGAWGKPAEAERYGLPAAPASRQAVREPTGSI